MRERRGEEREVWEDNAVDGLLGLYVDKSRGDRTEMEERKKGRGIDE